MDQRSNTIGRRAFLGAAAAGAMIVKPGVARGSAANSAVRLALYGCGGRGTGVAESFIENTAAEVIALGDLFEDPIQRAKRTLDTASAKRGKPGAGAAMMFAGPNSLDRLIESKDIDAVYIATPPYFHPAHLEKVVAAGKHVYCEKPVSVDVPGAKRAMRAGERAGGRLSLAIGFQLRHATPYVRLVERVKAGALGPIVCGLSHYYAGGIERPSWPNASPAERRLRNWIYDRVISGDIIVEQNIHLIDVNNWVLGAHPLKAQGTGGRAGRNDPGDCWSHFNVNFTYPNDVHITLTSTQFIQGSWDVAVRFFGADSNAEMHYDSPVRITGKNPWEFPGLGAPGSIVTNQAAVTGAFKGALDDADAMKQKNFIESITSGKFLNEAAQGAESALSAIMGRSAAYTGREWTWEEVLRSEEALDARLDVSKL